MLAANVPLGAGDGDSQARTRRFRLDAMHAPATEWHPNMTLVPPERRLAGAHPIRPLNRSSASTIKSQNFA